MVKRIEVIEQFRAMDEQGNAYTVLIEEEVIDAAHMGDRNAEIRGMKRVKLSDGSPCNRIDDNTFMIVATDTTIYRQ